MARLTGALQEAQIILEVLRRIPSSYGVTASEVLSQLEAVGYSMSLRTMQRYLKAAADSDIGVICDSRSKPYKYQRVLSKNALEDAGLNPRSCLLLMLAREHLKYQMPPAVMRSMQHLFDAASVYIAQHSSKKGDTPETAWLKKIAVVSGALPQIAPDIAEGVFNDVSEALFRGLKLDLTYEKADGTLRDSRVIPLGLVQQGVRLYLVAKYDNSSAVRNFALHRIKSAHLTTFTFDEKQPFDLQAYANSSHFNYGNYAHGGEIFLEFDFTNPVTAKNLKETPFNRTQRIYQTKDGLWHLSVFIEDSMLLTGWLKTWEDISGIRNVRKTPVSKMQKN